MTTWLKDANGNRCSIEHFGSKEAAQKALDSLKDCRDCTNCSDCSYCSRCSGCLDCSGCWDCSGCSGCSRCSYCLGCSGCSYCSDCSYCLDCSDCSRCSRCSGCSGCSYCSGCSGCSGCSYCSDCSYCLGCSVCSRCWRCWRCSGCSGEKDKKGDFTPPSVPRIENIHQKIYAAATASDKAFDMRDWHTCETTHCRAGWAVHLAGDAGYALERYYGPVLAAQLIYEESGTKISPTKFYGANEIALADMKKMAEADEKE